MARPIRLREHIVRIKAPRDIVYQKMSPFGSGRLQGDNGESSRVISRDGDTIVAEFKTRVGPLTYTTVEEVVLERPDRISFRHLKGPLHRAWEQFEFRDVDGDMELVHRGEFVWRRLPVAGWRWGRLWVKPWFERLIVKHMRQVQESCEARAARSHVFPRRDTARSA